MGLHDSPGSPRSTTQKRLGTNLDEADDGPLIDKEGKYGKRYKVTLIALPASSLSVQGVITSCQYYSANYKHLNPKCWEVRYAKFAESSISPCRYKGTTSMTFKSSGIALISSGSPAAQSEAPPTTCSQQEALPFLLPSEWS